MAIAKFFYGQQDGYERNVPDGVVELKQKVLWIADQFNSRELEVLRKSGMPITTQRMVALSNLPYVLTSSYVDEDGEAVLRYEFCPEMMRASSEETTDS